jgi:hypothetical protein
VNVLKREFCRNRHKPSSRRTFDLTKARVFSLPIHRSWAIELRNLVLVATKSEIRLALQAAQASN